MTPPFRLLAASLIALAAATPAARTLDPVGVYALIDRVVELPSDAAPNEIQLWGAFVFADDRAPDGYGPAERGYLYYRCPAGRRAACAAEWGDFVWIAGTGKGIGFGNRGGALGRVRAAAQPATSPDAYPLQGGTAHPSSKDPTDAEILARLKTAPPMAR